MTKQTIGEFLATLRKANGYTQQEVADRLAISNRTLSGWECDKVLPDILLLPALAELYGVTVDEILAGERKIKEDRPLTCKSEKNIYKNKLVRFNTQSCILLGVCILSGALVLCGVYGLGIVVFLIGLLMLSACVFSLMSFWRGAEISVDEDSQFYGIFCISIRRRLSICLYIISAIPLTISVTCLFQFIKGDSFLMLPNISWFTGLIFIALNLLAAFAIFTLSWLIYQKGISKWGDEKTIAHLKKSGRFSKITAVICLIPIILSITLVIVLNVVEFKQEETVYENASEEEFVTYMETLSDGMYHFPLSELAQNSRKGDSIDFEGGYTVRFDGFTFTICNRTVGILHIDESGFRIDDWYIEIQRFMSIDENRIDYSVFNVRYWYNSPHYNHRLVANARINNRYIADISYDIRRVDNGGLAYIQITEYDYAIIGNIVATTVITADLIVCAILCMCKRYKFTVKL